MSSKKPAGSCDIDWELTALRADFAVADSHSSARDILVFDLCNLITNLPIISGQYERIKINFVQLWSMNWTIIRTHSPHDKKNKESWRLLNSFHFWLILQLSKNACLLSVVLGSACCGHSCCYHHLVGYLQCWRCHRLVRCKLLQLIPLILTVFQ